MAEFQAAEHAWRVRITVGAIRDIRDRFGVDLTKIEQAETWTALEDPVLLVDILYLLCKSQADEIDMTDEAFGAMFDGDSIESATTALLDAMTDFFPSGRRQILTAARAKAETINEQATNRMMAALEEIDENDLFGEQFSSAPESSGSNHGIGASGNSDGRPTLGR